MGARTAIFLILAAIVLSSCATPDKQPEDPDWNKAAVALFLIRSGYDRWAAACGHEWGKRGATREVALANCTIDHQNSGLAHDEIVAKRRSEEHTSELQSLMRIPYAVFCLKKK